MGNGARLGAPATQRGVGKISFDVLGYLHDDGNLVAYEVMQPANWLRPYWSMYTGLTDEPCGGGAAAGHARDHVEPVGSGERGGAR